MSKLILTNEVAGLGSAGDVVEVKAGYARNYLTPRGLAIPASEGALAQAEQMRRTRMLKDAKDRESAEEIAKVLVPTTITLKARAGGGGKLFGSVSAADVVAAIAAQTRIEIDRRKVRVTDHIKTTGEHQVQIRLHSDVEFPVTVSVAAG